MDDFKHYRTKKARPKSVDGFIRRPGPSIGSNFGDKPKKRTSKKAEVSTIANFKSPDGFTARNFSQADLPDGSSTGRRPIYKKDLDLSVDTKKGKDKRASREGRNWKRGIKRSFAGLSAMLILFSGFLVGLTYLRANQIFQGGTSALALDCEVDPKRLQKEGDGRVNILMLGKGGLGHEGADLTDTILVASVDSCQKEVGLLSIPRDLYVKMPGDGSMKINAVYATAKEQALASGKSDKEAEKIGIKKTEQVVENVLGIPIHYYAMVDFEAFRRSIDTVGGVDINVKEKLYDPTVAWENNWNPLIAATGWQHFDGKKALLYARSRHGSARGDFDRAQRQREILVALRNKIFSLGTFGNPLKLSQLVDAFGDHAQTNLSVDDLMHMYNIVQSVDDHKITSLGLADPPNDFVTTGNIGGLSVVIPKEGTYDYDAIGAYVRNALKDGFLRKENSTVMVLNGTTTPGLATQYADVLKSYGYNVGEVGDAPTKTNGTTQVVDLTHGQKKYTKRYLEQRYKTKATSNAPAGVNVGTADFVIIVGQDETSN